MIFEATAIADSFVVRLARHEDERGFFARAWCLEEFSAHGVALPMVQASISHTRLAGTLRGLHYSKPPSREGKLVRCERGRMYDVIVDLRPGSATFLQHFSIELDEQRRDAVFIPPGVAHGFQTLADDCDVMYMMTEAYRPELADGVRHDDIAFGICWPLPVSVISERDRAYPDFDPSAHVARADMAQIG